jgi:hypothetical protein
MHHFRVGSREVQAEVVESSSEVSEYSGKPLAKARISFAVPPEVVDEIKDAIIDHKFASKDESGNSLEWKVETSSESYTGNPWQSNHKFIVELKLRERLEVEELIINDLSLRPYAYEESSNKAGLEIVARVKLSRAETDQLRQLQLGESPVAVVRRGISDSPRVMTFGRVLWSGSDEGFKLNVVLFDESRVQYSTLGDPTVIYPTKVAFENKSKINKLLEILKSKAVLTESEAEVVNSVVPDPEEWLSLDRVKDLDEFLSR